MKKKTTPSDPAKQETDQQATAAADGKTPRPSRATLEVIRRFAYNYYVEPQLPQGMQEIILG